MSDVDVLKSTALSFSPEKRDAILAASVADAASVSSWLARNSDLSLEKSENLIQNTQF